jgi:TonB family protein
MKRLHGDKAQPRLLRDPASVEKRGLLKAGTFSLFLHIAFLVIFSLSLKSSMSKMGPSVYRVTLRPLLGDGLPKGGLGLPGSEGLTASFPGEKPKPVEKPGMEKSKKGEIPPATKKQKSPEPRTRNEMVEGLRRSSKKVEKFEKEKSSSSSLQEALEEIRKKAALDRIQKRVARREELERDSTESGSMVETKTESGSGTETERGSGTGIGSGTGGSPGGSPWGSPFGGSSALQSKLDEYYSMIWEKIKKEWTLPGDLLKGKTDLETIIVIIIERDGKIQKSWFEKRSGNALYDQSAMRAIKKADPLPPIPKEFSDTTFEIGIRFYPE